MQGLKKEDIKDFTLGIEHGCFYWKVELKDNTFEYNVKICDETYKFYETSGKK